jgi:hypothetical protein
MQNKIEPTIMKRVDGSNRIWIFSSSFSKRDK